MWCVYHIPTGNAIWLRVQSACMMYMINQYDRCKYWGPGSAPPLHCAFTSQHYCPHWLMMKLYGADGGASQQAGPCREACSSSSSSITTALPSHYHLLCTSTKGPINTTVCSCKYHLTSASSYGSHSWWCMWQRSSVRRHTHRS